MQAVDPVFASVYSLISKDLQNFMSPISSNLPLRSLYFNITEGCNNACRFCASNSPDQNKHYMSTEAVCEALGKYSSDLISQVVINGGEPTTHPGFKKIINRAIKTGGRVILFTNGRAFARKTNTIDIDIHSLHRISIPIYYVGSKGHDGLVGRKGAWNQTMLGLQNIDGLRNSDLGPAELELKLLAIRPSLSEWDSLIDKLSMLIRLPERVVLSGLILSSTLLSHGKELIPVIDELYSPINASIKRLRDLGIKLIILWSIPWCVLDKDNLDYFNKQAYRNKPSTSPKPVEDLYFDYRYPDGITLMPTDQEAPDNDFPICRWCDQRSLCGGMPAFLQFSRGEENVLHLPIKS